MARQTWAALMAPALCALLLGASGAAAETVMHGRISFAEAKGLIKGTADEDWSYATVNSLVLPGDSIWADDEGAVEVEFSGGTFLRLADGSRADVVSLPPSAVFRGVSGSFYVQRVRRSAGDVVFETEVAKVTVDPNSQVRFDVLSEGPTTVTVRWGRAIIRTEGGGTAVVLQGSRSYIDPGYLPSTPMPFDRNVEDAFDSWNRERARYLALGTEHVPIVEKASYGYDYSSAPLGVSDLNAYGEWVYVDDRYYWRPTVIVDYVPYRYGYWSYNPYYGHVWVGRYPFSYITSHYGYWDFHPRYGWIWSYYPYYAPAYVAAVHCGDWFLWAPINRFGQPVVVGHSYFTVGGLHFSYASSSFVYASDLFFGPSFVHPFSPTQVVNIHADNVFIWNFFGVNRPQGRHPITETNLPARDYTPRRVMRGPDTISDSLVLAGNRATTLESRVTGLRARPETGNVTRLAPSAETTPIPPADRSANVRRVSLDRASLDATSTALRQAERSAVSTRQLLARRPSGTLNNDDVMGSQPIRSITPSTRALSNRSTAPDEAGRAPGTERIPTLTNEDALNASRPLTRVDGDERSVRGNVPDPGVPRTTTPSLDPIEPTRRDVNMTTPLGTRRLVDSSRPPASSFTPPETTRPVPRVETPQGGPMTRVTPPAERGTRTIVTPENATPSRVVPRPPASSTRIEAPAPRVTTPAPPARIETPPSTRIAPPAERGARPSAPELRSAPSIRGQIPDVAAPSPTPNPSMRSFEPRSFALREGYALPSRDASVVGPRTAAPETFRAPASSFRTEGGVPRMSSPNSSRGLFSGESASVRGTPSPRGSMGASRIR